MRAHHSDHFVLPLPAGHRFPMQKYRLLREAIAAQLPEVQLVEAPAASAGELALAHEPSYVSDVFEGTLHAARQREIGFPWSPQMAERARRSVGATIAAARAALSEGISGNLAGGTHHASADRGGGFCVFNDVAVAARLMQAEWHRHHGPRHPSLRVAVVDLDVHQGNGTAAILTDDPSVFTLSLHGARNYPFDKVASDLDVDLPDGCDDDGYLTALDGALSQLWRHHGDAPPGLIFFIAGADPHEGDRLGRLKLTAAGLAERDRRVLRAAVERRIPLAISMGGGYGHDVAQTVALHLQTWREALVAWQLWQGSQRWQTARHPSPPPSAERPLSA
jgi:acetoin utilization deacetylase AcuC-like enzyme